MHNQPQRLSMLRSYTAADALTLANASCGTLSIFLCLSYLADNKSVELWLAFVLPIFALMFDALDGTFTEISLRRDPDCPVCGESPTITEYIDYVEFCAGVGH